MENLNKNKLHLIIFLTFWIFNYCSGNQKEYNKIAIQEHIEWCQGINFNLKCKDYFLKIDTIDNNIYKNTFTLLSDSSRVIVLELSLIDSIYTVISQDYAHTSKLLDIKKMTIDSREFNIYVFEYYRSENNYNEIFIIFLCENIGIINILGRGCGFVFNTLHYVDNFEKNTIANRLNSLLLYDNEYYKHIYNKAFDLYGPNSKIKICEFIRYENIK